MLDEVPEGVSQTGGNEVGGVAEEDGGLFAGFRMAEGSLMRGRRIRVESSPRAWVEGLTISLMIRAASATALPWKPMCDILSTISATVISRPWN
jgi:hypothetical protein